VCERECVCVRVCVRERDCVCVRERDRDRDRQTDRFSLGFRVEGLGCDAEGL
jgi:hypothetical protein